MFTSALRVAIKRFVLASISLLIGCSGPAFSGVEFSDVPVSMAGAPDNGGGSFAAGGKPSIDSAGSPQSGGSSAIIMSGSAGAPEGIAGEPSADWLCRAESGICQCYQDPSQFKEGWLDRPDCPVDKWCTVREDTACVCWDSEGAYRNALTLPDSHEVESCPP